MANRGLNGSYLDTTRQRPSQPYIAGNALANGDKGGLIIPSFDGHEELLMVPLRPSQRVTSYAPQSTASAELKAKQASHESSAAVLPA